MKAALLCILLLLSGTAQAASPVESYVGARDRAIRALEVDSDDAGEKGEREALADLQNRLAGLIGSIDLRGFGSQATINLQTLQQGLGFGLLDGLAYTSADQSTRAVVTTKDLLETWLHGHRDASDSPERTIPQDLQSALQSEAFYTQAISSDAAVARYVELPVESPARDGFAYAMLSSRRQDLGPGQPDEIIVSVLQGDKVFILTQPAETKIQKIPACNDVWQQYSRKASRALKAYRASNDEKVFEESRKLEEEGDRQYRRCFAKRVKDQAAYQAARRQARALVQRLPAP